MQFEMKQNFKKIKIRHSLCYSSLSRVSLFAVPWTVARLCPWDFPGKNTGVGCHFLLKGIFPTQGSNPGLLHWQVDSLPLSHILTLGRNSLENKVSRSSLFPGEVGRQ